MNENKHKIVGNIIVVSIFSVAIIISCFVGVFGLAEYKSKRNDIDIRGWAKQQITSDLIVWSGSFDVTAVNLKDGYNNLEADRAKVKNYLITQGFEEKELIFSSVCISENYVINQMGSATNEIADYDLSQTVTISSDKIDKVTDISRKASELINDGVHFQSNAPEYHYTKLDDLKVTMLSEATKDAKKRAEMIAQNADCKLGKLAHAHITDIKVTPLYYVPDDYYDEYGDYVKKDTVSLEKEVTVVVYCTFEIK